MKRIVIQSIKILVLLWLFLLSCDKIDDVKDDVDKTKALKNVTLTYDSMSYELSLPEGALSGKSFDELKKLDSSKYTNPANYTIEFFANFNANNTKEEAEDAKFDGLDIDMIMDTIESNPIEIVAGDFEVKKGDVLPVEATGSINLETHRNAGIYIFQQIVDGEDLATTLSPFLKYSFGSQQGEIPVPSLKKDIPTRASEETKEFLNELLQSGVFDAK